MQARLVTADMPVSCSRARRASSHLARKIDAKHVKVRTVDSAGDGDARCTLARSSQLVWTLPVPLLFCLFLVDNAGLLALCALSFCNVRMGLLVGLWNHIVLH